MKTLKYVLFVLLILVIGASVYVGVQPNEYEVTRTRTMLVPQKVIYNNVIEFRTWETWSSWIEEKPETKIYYPEVTKGIDGSYSWEDDDGIGNMKTTDANEFNSIEQELQFGDFEPSKVTWTFEPDSIGGTKVTWQMKGEKVPFMFKLFAVASGGFDNMIGPDFERGLEKMDSLLTESVNKHEVTIEGIKEYGGGFYLYKTTNANRTNISQKMAENYGAIGAYMSQNQINMNGMPLTVYLDMNQEDDTVIMSNGIPVNERIEIAEDSDILCGYIPNTKVLKANLMGNYTYLGEAWAEVMAYIASNNLVQSEVKPFEIYINDPGDFPNPADWKTEIYIPLQD